jgi:hypothetical protein
MFGRRSGMQSHVEADRGHGTGAEPSSRVVMTGDPHHDLS